MTDAIKKTLTTYVEWELYDKVWKEARLKQVSVAAVLRWAVIDRYEKQAEREAG